MVIDMSKYKEYMALDIELDINSTVRRYRIVGLFYDNLRFDTRELTQNNTGNF